MKEEEIRPKLIFDEYLRLAEIDTKTYFLNTELDYILCPACNSKGEFAFEKSGFRYESCKNCGTLFVSPRAKAEAFKKYYKESPSSNYWATTFYKVTAVSRREKLWKPKAKEIINILKKFKCDNSHSIVDIGGGYGLFAEEINILSKKKSLIIEPGPNLAKICREKGLNVVQKFLEDVSKNDLPSGNKCFVSFELFEHLHDPLIFLKKLYELMNNGDLFIFTTLSGLGVDIQALWNDSKSVSPPHHINFFNPYSSKIIVEQSGLNILEITTPGKLDVDILVNNQEKIKDRFLKSFIKFSTPSQRESFQSWIASNCLSSHMWVVCNKKG